MGRTIQLTERRTVQDLDRIEGARERIRLFVDAEFDGRYAEIDVARTALPHYVAVRLGNCLRRIDLRAADAAAASQLLQLCYRAMAGKGAGFVIDAAR